MGFRSGWARNGAGGSRAPRVTAVSLRMPWVQTPEGFAGQIGPRRASGDAGRDLWSYIDARDAADAFLLALQACVEGHARVMISAADSYMDEPTAELAERAFPNVTRNPMPGFASTFDLDNARRTWATSPAIPGATIPQA